MQDVRREYDDGNYKLRRALITIEEMRKIQAWAKNRMETSAASFKKYRERIASAYNKVLKQ